MICECCGGSGQVPDRPPGAFNKREVAIWRAILRRDGISSEQLAATVYASDPNGGPESARSCVVKAICLMKKKLVGSQFTIHSGRGTPGYRIRKNVQIDNQGRSDDARNVR
jgi:hypothetical protein